MYIIYSWIPYMEIKHLLFFGNYIFVILQKNIVLEFIMFFFKLVYYWTHALRLVMNGRGFDVPLDLLSIGRFLNWIWNIFFFFGRWLLVVILKNNLGIIMGSKYWRTIALKKIILGSNIRK